MNLMEIAKGSRAAADTRQHGADEELAETITDELDAAIADDQAASPIELSDGEGDSRTEFREISR